MPPCAKNPNRHFDPLRTPPTGDTPQSSCPDALADQPRHYGLSHSSQTKSAIPLPPEVLVRHQRSAMKSCDQLPSPCSSWAEPHHAAPARSRKGWLKGLPPRPPPRTRDQNGDGERLERTHLQCRIVASRSNLSNAGQFVPTLVAASRKSTRSPVRQAHGHLPSAIFRRPRTVLAQNTSVFRRQLPCHPRLTGDHPRKSAATKCPSPDPSLSARVGCRSDAALCFVA